MGPRFANAPASDAGRRKLAPAPASKRPGLPLAEPQAKPVGSTLTEVRAELGDCRRCGLCQARSNIVFGVGSETADIVFVGEGPGFHEDRQGEPFVGESGELLTRIINNVLRLDRSDVYICNVVKCRPPQNRNPEPAEVAACSPFLRAQLAVIKPKIVVALGRFAIQTLLGSTDSVGRLRGTAHPFEGAVLVPTYHPAYLLRNPADKRKTMQDMMLVRSEFERITGAPLPPVQRRQR
ncbi:MAG: uracil-DNA glycosylase [Deltaproteobacteria bacterium]|nr:uracil-DNA glycosylase [Deltaproteobacteria bacterium]